MDRAIVREPAGGAGDVIDATGLVAMPGLINTHCHAAMTFLRGVAEDVPIANWFNDYIWPMEVNVGGRDVYIGTMVAAAEMIESGITSFADHYFFMDEAARAVEESGMRANLGSAFFSSQGERRAGPVGRVRRDLARPRRRADHHLDRAACPLHLQRRRPARRGRCGPADRACGCTSTLPRTCTRPSSASTGEASPRSRCSPRPACSTPA